MRHIDSVNELKSQLAEHQAKLDDISQANVRKGSDINEKLLTTQNEGDIES